MEMASAHESVQVLLNGHSWYRIETPLDWVRATLWCVANFLTAIAYFAIPNELRGWRKTLPFAASSTIVLLFIGFITLCGASHFAMLFIMQTGPWWAVLLIYLPMAAVSVATVVVLRVNRRTILAVLQHVGDALKAPP
ncbi:MAG: hypothetical protein WDN01_09230 [Rhizomicrobium sp.]